MSKSEKPDNELTMYQLHSRYCILNGMSMDEAAELWNREFKDKEISRDELMNSLNEIFQGEGRKFKEDEAPLIKDYFEEGERYKAEISKNKRNASLVKHRLEKDNYTCQHCGFASESISTIPLESVLVEVHHIEPLQEGQRQTVIEDLITLCPNCHKLIHAIGKQIEADCLPSDLLSTYCP